MRLRSRKYSPVSLSVAFRQPWLKRLYLYAIILMFVSMSDAIMTFYSPVYINEHVSSEFIMGLVIASSSVVGLCCDIFFGEFFKGKYHQFFLIRSIVFAFLFSLSYLFFPPIVVAFLLSMALWGVYYELILFSDFHFINHALDHPHHAMGWSILKSFTGIAYLVGPLIASYLLAINDSLPPIGAILLLMVALIIYLIFKPTLNKRSPADVHQQIEKKSLVHEFKLWGVLLPVLWPVLLFIFILTVMDATFWTVGSVLSENLTENHFPGGLLVIAYMLPNLFAGYLSAPFSAVLGKKRTAFICGAASGLFFIAAGLSTSIPVLLILMFIASIFSSMAIPEIYGAIEDYIERLGHSANGLIGLENSTTSLSFIIGPIAAGLIATLIGNQATFAVMGFFILLISILALIIVKRKIRLPQKSISHLI